MRIGDGQTEMERDDGHVSIGRCRAQTWRTWRWEMEGKTKPLQLSNTTHRSHRPQFVSGGSNLCTGDRMLLCWYARREELSNVIDVRRKRRSLERENCIEFRPFPRSSARTSREVGASFFYYNFFSQVGHVTWPTDVRSEQRKCRVHL